MERLIDDCIILDYGRILIQQPIKQLLDQFHRYTFDLKGNGLRTLPSDQALLNSSVIRNHAETYSFEGEPYVRGWLERNRIDFGRPALRKLEPRRRIYRSDGKILIAPSFALHHTDKSITT